MRSEATVSRELSDQALLHQLAAFLAYEAKGRGMCFHDWADSKDFAPADRTWIEVSYMWTRAPQGQAS